jgi:hypothetical protein
MYNLQDNNPFLKIKARNLFILYFIITFLVIRASVIITSYTGFSRKDPILIYIYYCLTFGVLCVWVLRRFYKLKINVRYLIGNFPKGYNLLPIFGIVVALIAFSAGATLLSKYVL